MKRLLLLSALFFVTLTACGEDPADNDSEEQTEQITTLEVHVMNDMMSPTAGADVIVENDDISLEEVSDEEGMAVFTDIEPGEYTVRIELEWHDSVEKSVTVEDGETTEATLQFYLGTGPEQ